ncbi:type VII secretion protein EccE [Kribbella solani]|uniref:Type VII secretion system protein EccE domain-containing protein n=1 Tax=Kribbella solani TaxID=236067 RepID=A0A841DRF8_9ACTN|nr:type VII secretion protein EccE [Kribbella solani]MBB5981172.1 hypothetical protein [Kribbella solani]
MLEAAAGLVALLVVAITATWRHGTWTYTWAQRGISYLIRGTSFTALDGVRGHLTLGTNDLGTIIRADGITVLLESDLPADLTPADLLDEQPPPGVHLKLIRRPGRVWIGVTAVRSQERSQDTDLELLLTNTIRRLTKRLHRRGLRAEPLTPDELSTLFTTLTPKRLTEEWDALVLDQTNSRYRMYAVPTALALHQPGAVTVTTASNLDHALVLAHAAAPQSPAATAQTGRHRAAFTAALP